MTPLQQNKWQHITVFVLQATATHNAKRISRYQTPVPIGINILNDAMCFAARRTLTSRHAVYSGERCHHAGCNFTSSNTGGLARHLRSCMLAADIDSDTPWDLHGDSMGFDWMGLESEGFTGIQSVRRLACTRLGRVPEWRIGRPGCNTLGKWWVLATGTFYIPVFILITYRYIPVCI